MILFVSGCPALPTAELADARFVVDERLSGQTFLELPDSGAAVPIFDHIADKSGSHAPTIAALGDGTLIVAWYAYDGPHELRGADIYVSRREPHDETWSRPNAVVDRRESVGNPVLFAEGTRLWLFFAVVPGGWSTARIEFVTSNDAGVTWSAPAVLSSRLGSNVRYPPVRLESGALLLPAYDDLLQRSLFFVSEDDGTRWSLRSELASPTRPGIQPAMVQRDDGTLLAVLRAVGGGTKLVSAESSDEGRSWRVWSDSGLFNPGSPAALTRIGPQELALVYNDSPAKRNPLSIVVSNDDGRTWAPPKVLVDAAGAHSYPATAVTADALHVVYSHDRRWIGYVRLSRR